MGPPVGLPGPKKGNRLISLSLGYPCQDFGLWHGVSVRRISMRGGLWGGEKNTLLGLKMCTCELSLLNVDPDVNRSFLMSKKVDKPALIPPSIWGCRPQMASTQSTAWCATLRMTVDCRLFCSVFAFFLLAWGFGCEPGRTVVQCQ